MEHLNPELIKKTADRNKKKDKFDFGLVKRDPPKKQTSIFDAIIKPTDSTEGRK